MFSASALRAHSKPHRRPVGLPQGIAATALREEMDLLIGEEHYLMRIAGMAAYLISQLDPACLSPSASKTAYLLSRLINDTPNDVLTQAIEAVHAKHPLHIA